MLQARPLARTVWKGNATAGHGPGAQSGRWKCRACEYRAWRRPGATHSTTQQRIRGGRQSSSNGSRKPAPTGNNSTNTPAQACLCESNLKASTGLRRDVWRRFCSPTAPTSRRCTVWWRRGSPCPLVRCCLLLVVVLILVSVERHDVVGGVPHRRLFLQRGGRTDNR